MQMLKAKLSSVKAKRENAEKLSDIRGDVKGYINFVKPDPILCCAAYTLVKDHRTNAENGKCKCGDGRRYRSVYQRII